jgi:heat shock protein HtpX
MSKFYNNLKTALLLGMLTALIVWAGSAIGGRGGLMIALVMAGVMNMVAYFYSDKIALMSMRAQEVGPEHELYQIVGQLVGRANLPMPRVYVSPEQAPNAFATGRNPNHAAVCATEGLLQILTREEIAGVMSHELAHVRHRDILIQSVAATIGAAIGFIAQFAMFGGMGGRRDDDDRDSSPLLALAFAILGPIAAMLIQAAISRSREFNADKTGAEICGDPMYLATALEKIHAYANRIPLQVNPAFNSMFIAEPFNAMKAIGGLFQTHPPLEARLENLIGQPTTGLLR